MSVPADGRRAGAMLAAVGLGLCLPLVVAVVALADRRWYPVLDLAMTEFRIRDVGTADTPLIGLPGRIGELPDQGSHPGPLSFWLLAPGYRLFGGTAWAMEAATVVLQMCWVALALWIGRRRNGWVGVATVAVVLAVLVRGYGLTALVQPWNPYLPLLAWLVVLLATWSVYCGDHAMLVPLVVAASFSAQTHIPYLLMSGALGLSAVMVVLVRWWRGSTTTDDTVEVDAPTGRRPPRIVVVTVAVFGGLWLAPIVEQFVRDEGNLSRLADHFGSPPEEAIGAGAGLRLLFRHLDVVGAVGGLFGDDGGFLREGFDPDGPIWAGVVLFACWIGAVVVARRLGHTPLVRLHALLGLTLALSFVSMSRIFGQRWFYLTLWAWCTTVLLCVSIVWTAVAWWRRHRPDRGEVVAPRRLVVAGAVLAGVVTLSTVVAAPSTDHPEEHLGATVGLLLPSTVAAIEAGVGVAEGIEATYVVDFDDAYFFGSQAFALLAELRRSGIDAYMYDFWRVPSTEGRVLAGRTPTAEVILATGGFVEAWRNDDRVVEVATVEPRDADELALFDELRAELVADLTDDGLVDLVELVDTNLFGLNVDQRISAEARTISARMIDLGQETSVFLGPPGVGL